MGGGASRGGKESTARYKDGLTESEYFDEKVMTEMGPLFALLDSASRACAVITVGP
jgi:hypothetical protein